MRQWNRIVLAAGMALVIAAGMAATGCGKNKTTNPSGGGVGLELNSPDIPQNGTFSHTFAAADTFTYHCAIHTSMHGAVHVRVGEALLANVSISGFAFSPNPVIVGPGGTVTWTNQDGTAHTVTSDSAIP